MKDIPYIAHESEVARLERIIKRLWILCIIIFTLFVLSNGLWVYYNNQFQTVRVTQEATADSGDAFVNNGGDFTYGKSKTDDNIQSP